MTNDQFKAWRKTFGYSQPAAARALGVSLSTVKAYERGTWTDGRPAVVSDTVSILIEHMIALHALMSANAKRAKGK